MIDFRYKYAKKRQKVITSEMVANMIGLLLDSDKSWWKSLLNGAKLTLTLAGFILLKSIQNDELLIEKQEYEQSQGQGNQSEIDKEDMERV